AQAGQVAGGHQAAQAHQRQLGAVAEVEVSDSLQVAPAGERVQSVVAEAGLAQDEPTCGEANSTLKSSAFRMFPLRSRVFICPRSGQAATSGTAWPTARRWTRSTGTAWSNFAP